MCVKPSNTAEVLSPADAVRGAFVFVVVFTGNKLSLCYTKRSSTRSFFCLSTRMVSPSADVSIALSAVPAEVEVAG